MQDPAHFVPLHSAKVPSPRPAPPPLRMKGKIKKGKKNAAPAPPAPPEQRIWSLHEVADTLGLKLMAVCDAPAKQATADDERLGAAANKSAPDAATPQKTPNARSAAPQKASAELTFAPAHEAAAHVPTQHIELGGSKPEGASREWHVYRAQHACCRCCATASVVALMNWGMHSSLRHYRKLVQPAAAGLQWLGVDSRAVMTDSCCVAGDAPECNDEIDINDLEAVRAEMARRDSAKRSLATPGSKLHGFAQAARRRLRRICRAMRADDAVLSDAAKASCCCAWCCQTLRLNVGRTHQRLQCCFGVLAVSSECYPKTIEYLCL